MNGRAHCSAMAAKRGSKCPKSRPLEEGMGCVRNCSGSRRTISASVYMLGRRTGHSPVGSVRKLPSAHRMVHGPAGPGVQCDLRSSRG